MLLRYPQQMRLATLACPPLIHIITLRPSVRPPGRNGVRVCLAINVSHGDQASNGRSVGLTRGKNSPHVLLCTVSGRHLC